MNVAASLELLIKTTPEPLSIPSLGSLPIGSKDPNNAWFYFGINGIWALKTYHLEAVLNHVEAVLNPRQHPDDYAKYFGSFYLGSLGKMRAQIFEVWQEGPQLYQHHQNITP